MCEGKTYLPPQSSQSLLLSMRVDISPNDKRDDIEERDPCMFRQEFLRER